MKHTSCKVSAQDDGMPLQAFVSAHLNLSRRQAKDIIDSRMVFVNGNCVWMARHTLKRGDSVELPPSQHTGAIDDRHLNIIYDQNGIIGVDKPAGMLCTGANSIETMLQKRFKNPELRMVHRLDRNTTGCVLASRNDEVRANLVTQFRDSAVTKVYHAIVLGRVANAEQTVTSAVGSQRAVSHIRVLDACRRATHLSIRIETGRTHQIRKHLAGLRHPVLGDLEHGRMSFERTSCEDLKVKRQMLHSASVRFTDPKSGEVVCARATLAADMRACLRELKLK